MTAASLNAQSLRNEKWFDNASYPFADHYFETEGRQMHYVDEGEGETILFVHGTPAWSYLYRKFILAFSSDYRCIAPDHIGFGMSDKPRDYEYNPARHSKNLEALVDHLGLKNITLVVHDFGGPIGLSFAIRRPELIRRIVVMNTWLWETKDEADAQKADRILKSGMGRFLYLNMNFSPRFLFKKAFANKKALPKRVHRHYFKVFPGKKDRYGLLGIGLALAGASGWYGEQWAQFDRIADKDLLFLWGEKDPFIPLRYLEKWQERLPEAEVKRFDAGHFLQEEKSEACIGAIREFMGK